MFRSINAFVVILSITSCLAAQDVPPISDPQDSKKIVTTIGILQGGGSLIGADFEFMLNKTLGVQLGAGLFGVGAGFNLHLKPYARSNFISIQYWNQGLGDRFAQGVAGATFVWRGKKWFTAQLGMGARVVTGDLIKGTRLEDVPVMLLYSIGGYF